MTRYPRRDVVHVAYSTQQGGCGASHTRPVTRGVPDPNWELVCPQCEEVIDRINDPHWAKTRAEIPETPDEMTKRESLKNQKDRSLEEIQTFAMAKMAGIDIDANFQRGPLRGQQTICKNGHHNPSASRFCGECGTSLSAADIGILNLTPSASTSTYTSGTNITYTVGSGSGGNGGGGGGGEYAAKSPDYSKMKVAELRRVAEQQGINPKQSKKQLVEALS